MCSSAPRAVPEPALEPVLDPAASPVMAMLSEHLPLTLLLDLALGVRSSEVFTVEPPDLSWLSPAAVPRAG